MIVKRNTARARLYGWFSMLIVSDTEFLSHWPVNFIDNVREKESEQWRGDGDNLRVIK